VVPAPLPVGITGGLQPDKLARSFNADGDGMYARVCFAWPDEPAYRPLSNDAAEIEPEIVNALCRIIDLEAGDLNAFVPRNVPLSVEARVEFEQFRRFLHTGKEALDGREREWWAKGASQVLRLAGALAYLGWSLAGGVEPSAIEGEHLRSAIELWRNYFWPHSRAALRQIGLSERHANARRALRWIRAHRKMEVGVKDIRREALAQSLDAKQTDELLNGLAGAGWLIKKTESTRGRPVHRWSVNPILFSGAENAETAGSAEGLPEPVKPRRSQNSAVISRRWLSSCFSVPEATIRSATCGGRKRRSLPMRSISPTWSATRCSSC
jgi:Protein of unknown function (DUF3987)